MVDIPEHLLQRSAEARAKALGISVEQALAEMKGESDPTVISKEPEVKTIDETPAPAAETPAPAAETPAPAAETPAPAVKAEEKPAAKAPEPDTPEEVDFAPEVKVTQRLLTVVKAKPIQKSVSEPVDKVNTWPHLMLPEFVSLMAMTAFLIFLSAILQAPLLEEANPNVTPNPAKAPWYFLGLQELLSYWDPQIAGVMIPLVLGVVLWMAFPYIDRNPETHPSKRKFAIMFYTFFLAGAGVLTIIGVLFRGPGWNWTYPWIDGIWFDDLLDWIHFE
jgi:menaquinol-cytochrome c reductase cytochrome b/c subunit|tara:strand:- start:2260 stop:3090 length:831 start_codon:yes stop_codon:yes gene_type:complete